MNTTTLFAISYVLLWLTVLTLACAVYLIFRYLGTMISSKGRRGEEGPELGQEIRSRVIEDIQGVSWILGRSSKQLQLIFFVSTDCRSCKRAMPFLAMLSEKRQSVLETILICRGKMKSLPRLVERLPPTVKVVKDEYAKISTNLNISNVPFAILVDSSGAVLVKGTSFEAVSNEIDSHTSQESATVASSAVAG